MDGDVSGKLLACFENLTFDPARKIGGKSYDDKRFYTSLKKKFDADHTVSERQFQALLAMAGRYRDRIDPARLAALPPEYREQLERVAVPAADAASANAPDPNLQGVFAALSKVTFEPPDPKRKRTFDDKKFFTSLRQQYNGGKALSEKQLAVLKRMAGKYYASLGSDPAVLEFLGGRVPESAAKTPVPARTPSAASGAPAQGAALLGELGRVTEWAAPVKRGRFTYDDRKFYTSVKKQFDEGKNLSDKQVAALARLAEKYRKKQDR